MREPIPFPVTVRPIPDGADLEISTAHYEHLLKDVFDVLGDNPELLDDLCALYANRPQQDPHMPDRPSRDDVLAEQIVAQLPPASTTIRIHRNPLTRLGAAIDTALGRHGWFPAMRSGRAAA